MAESNLHRRKQEVKPEPKKEEVKSKKKEKTE